MNWEPGMRRLCGDLRFFSTIRVSLFCAIASLFWHSSSQAQTVEDILPGTSYTEYSPLLAMGSLNTATSIARAYGPQSCKSAELVSTKVISVDEKVVFASNRKLKSGVWSEIWTFDTCGKKLPITVKFIADKKGRADIEYMVRAD